MHSQSVEPTTINYPSCAPTLNTCSNVSQINSNISYLRDEATRGEQALPKGGTTDQIRGITAHNLLVHINEPVLDAEVKQRVLWIYSNIYRRAIQMNGFKWKYKLAIRVNAAQ